MKYLLQFEDGSFCTGLHEGLMHRHEVEQAYDFKSEAFAKYCSETVSYLKGTTVYCYDPEVTE